MRIGSHLVAVNGWGGRKLARSAPAPTTTSDYSLFVPLLDYDVLSCVQPPMRSTSEATCRMRSDERGYLQNYLSDKFASKFGNDSCWSIDSVDISTNTTYKAMLLRVVCFKVAGSWVVGLMEQLSSNLIDITLLVFQILSRWLAQNAEGNWATWFYNTYRNV